MSGRGGAKRLCLSTSQGAFHGGDDHSRTCKPQVALMFLLADLVATATRLTICTRLTLCQYIGYGYYAPFRRIVDQTKQKRIQSTRCCDVSPRKGRASIVQRREIGGHLHPEILARRRCLSVVHTRCQQDRQCVRRDRFGRAQGTKGSRRWRKSYPRESKRRRQSEVCRQLSWTASQTLILCCIFTINFKLFYCVVASIQLRPNVLTLKRYSIIWKSVTVHKTSASRDSRCHVVR